METLAVKKVKRNTVSLKSNGNYSMKGLNKYDSKSPLVKAILKDNE